MRVRLGVIIAIVTAVGSTAGAQATGIDRAAWIAGCWELRATNRVITEMWMAPAGGSMMGASRTIIGTAMREYEHLRISVRGDTLVYTSIPSGQKETDFKSTTISATSITFENRAHDYPQAIIYRKVGADSIIARIEGPGPNNTTRGTDFPMRRVNCMTPPAPPAPPPAPVDTVVMDVDASPDGRQLAIVKFLGANWEIYVGGTDGSAPRRITDHAAVDYQPSWSPDGTRLAFASVREGHQEIYTMRPDGSDIVQLTRGTAHNSEPAWSPDGRRIVFRSERDGRGRIYVMNADGSDPKALTIDTLGNAAPSWSPDGKKILYSSLRAGHSEVHVMNADGSGQTQITTTAQGHSGTAMWSRDGRTIIFWSTRDGNDDVFVMSPDGSNVVNLTKHPSRDVPMGWSHDGTRILFRSTRDRPMNDIYSMKPDGSDVKRVTTTPTAPLPR